MTDEEFKELLAEEEKVGALIDANPTDKGLRCLAHHISLQIDAEYQDMAEAQRLGMRVTDDAFKAYKASHAWTFTGKKEEKMSVIRKLRRKMYATYDFVFSQWGLVLVNRESVPQPTGIRFRTQAEATWAANLINALIRKDGATSFEVSNGVF
jgi:hypothetical protein